MGEHRLHAPGRGGHHGADVRRILGPAVLPVAVRGPADRTLAENDRRRRGTLYATIVMFFLFYPQRYYIIRFLFFADRQSYFINILHYRRHHARQLRQRQMLRQSPARVHYVQNSRLHVGHCRRTPSTMFR